MSDDWVAFDPYDDPDNISTTKMLNDADLTPVERKAFFYTLDQIRNLAEV